jgi:ankyrin repeat domain-containing protein 50
VDDLHNICPGLIDVGNKRDDETQFESNGNNNIEGMTPTVRIAHFSVQEYLESDRIKLHRFALESASAHAQIAQICLVYLQEPGLSSRTLDQTKLEEFPLAHFAAMFWYHHYKNSIGATSRLDGLILRLFQQQDSFYTWVKLDNMETPWLAQGGFSLTLSQIASPVYYASLLGLDGVLHKLIKIRQEHASDGRALVNAQGGFYGNVLQAASWGGHEKVVQILMNAGADVHAQGGYYGNALQAASRGGHEKVIQILMAAGADVHVQGGKYGNALQAASRGGHEKVVQMLIDAGADVNAQGGRFGNALQAASWKCDEKMVQILIDAGADVHAQGGYYGNALQAVSVRGHEKVMQMLMNAGADVHAQGGYYGNALQAASEKGHEKVVQTLIDAGAVRREDSIRDREIVLSE